MCKHFGLVSNADHVTGSLHVFVPGRHPDFVFSSQERVGNSKLQVGDFVSFVEVGGVIKSLSRIDDVFEKRHKNGVLQVKVSVAFPPECTHPETGLMSGMLAWSPDFAFIGCLDICVSDYNSNQMYMAWIQRVPEMMKTVNGIQVSWEIVGGVFDECDEEVKKLIFTAPWNDRNHKYYSQMLHSHVSRNRKRVKKKTKTSNKKRLSKQGRNSLHGRTKFPQKCNNIKNLKDEYAGCYEGLVTAIKEECAFVWCLTLTFSEVLFINGPYKGMKVGDWIQFNVQVIKRPHFGCYLLGNVFKFIPPLLPSRPFNSTVMVSITVDVVTDEIEYFPTGEITVDTQRLGIVEFRNGEFRHDFCGKRLHLAVYKDVPSKHTGAVWRVFAISNEKHMKNDLYSYSNENHWSEKEGCESKYISCRELEQDALADTCSDSPYDDEIFTVDVTSLEEVKEHDPLIEPCFGCRDLPETSSSVYSDFISLSSNQVTEREMEKELSRREFSDIHSDRLSGFSDVEAVEQYDVSHQLFSNEISAEKQAEDMQDRTLEFWNKIWETQEVQREIAAADADLYNGIVDMMSKLSTHN